MPNTISVPVIPFQRESGRPSIEGERNENLFQTVERNWNNLHSAVLRRFSGSRIDLCDADLQYSDLYSSDLTCARLFRAKLQGASLYGASLAGSDLQHADLTGADLYRSDLRAADLREAILCGANLERAAIEDTDLRGAIYDRQTKFPKGFNPIDQHMCLKDALDTPAASA